jgi:hypothetical protein
MIVTFTIRPAAALFALLSAAGTLAACAGSNNGPPDCGAPSGPVELVYPLPGATGVPDTFPGVIFASTNGLPSTYEAILQEAGATLQVPQLKVKPAPSPLPTPYLQPYFQNPVFQVSGPTIVLAAGTKYRIYLNDANSDCNPSFFGSFTSQ